MTSQERAPLHHRLDELILSIYENMGKTSIRGWCNICSRPTSFAILGENLRETVLCWHCSSFNRSRWIQYVLQEEVRALHVRFDQLTLWNTESKRSLHRHLQEQFGDRYVSSEYFVGCRSGERIHGVLHQDICQTSFSSEAFNFILAGDVLEHVPDPKRAFREVRRVLRPGGKLIFTVPSGEESQRQSDVRARLRENGTIEYLKEPVYHRDPLRPNGILVYTAVFGEDLSEMVNRAGLIFRKRRLHKPFYGIIGDNAIVFIAERPQNRLP